MKALTVRQPYASLIALGHKLVENRSWSTLHRGPLAVHAGAAWHPAGGTDWRVLDAVSCDPAFGGALGPFPLPHAVDRTWFPRSRVLVIVDLIDCPPGTVRCCGPWGSPDTWHWVLAAPRAVDQAPVVAGRLGLWLVDLAVLGQDVVNTHTANCVVATDNSIISASNPMIR